MKLTGDVFDRPAGFVSVGVIVEVVPVLRVERVGFGGHVPDPANRMPVEEVEMAAGFQQPEDHARPGAEVHDPADRAAPGVHQVRHSVKLFGRLQNIAANPAGGSVQGIGFLLRDGEHIVVDVHAHHFPRAEIPEGERVGAAGALKVDRPSARQKRPQEIVLRRHEVRPSGLQERRPLLDFGGVAARRLAPSRPVALVPIAGFFIHSHILRCQGYQSIILPSSDSRLASHSPGSSARSATIPPTMAQVVSLSPSPATVNHMAST